MVYAYVREFEVIYRLQFKQHRLAANPCKYKNGIVRQCRFMSFVCFIHELKFDQNLWTNSPLCSFGSNHVLLGGITLPSSETRIS